MDGSNGAVHVVDNVIMPANVTLATVASSAGLTTLLTAVQAAGLTSVFTDVSQANKLTVFAPSNAAFAAVSQNIMSWLLHPRNVQGLTNVLTFHVATPAVFSRQLTNNQVIPTLDTGNSLTVTIAGSTVSVNGGE